ncbi:hypothetical protein LSAT2_005707, partial [Lamellibrachia satsuma]
CWPQRHQHSAPPAGHSDINTRLHLLATATSTLGSTCWPQRHQHSAPSAGHSEIN